MSLEIDEALREGFQRTVSTNGLLLAGVFLVFGFLNLVLSQSLLAALEPILLDQLSTLPQESYEQFRQSFQEPRPFAVGLSYPVALALTILAAVLAEALRIVTIRVFAYEDAEVFPTERALHRIVAATINGIVAGILVSIAVLVGVVFLVIPGIYAALSLFFVRQEIAVENKNFLDAIRDSWTLTGGNRWELLGLAIIIAVIGAIAGSPGFVLNFVDPMLGTGVSTAIGAATTVFGIAVATRAYEQLRREREALMNPDYEEPVDDPGYEEPTDEAGYDDPTDRPGY